MKLKFKKIFYDNFNNNSIAVLYDRGYNFYFFRVSDDEALRIINRDSSNYFINPEIFEKTKMNCYNLSISKYCDEYYKGAIEIYEKNKVSSYEMSCGELIYYSILLKKTIDITPKLFLDFLDDVPKQYDLQCDNKEYSMRYYC